MRKGFFVRCLILSYISFAFLIFATPNILGAEADFEVSPLLIKYDLNPGEVIKGEGLIINRGEKQEFNIISNADFINIENDKFVLDEGGDGPFGFTLDAKNLGPGVFAGEIVISGSEKEIILLSVLEIETPILSIDISTEFSQSSSQVMSGENLVMDIIVFKVGEQGEYNSILNYRIIDSRGNEIFSETQDLEIIKKQVKFTKIFPIPENVPNGDYVFSIAIEDRENGYIGTSSEVFLISDEQPRFSSRESGTIKNYYLYAAFGIIIVLILAFLVFNYFWDRRLANNAQVWNRKLIDIKKIKFGDSAREIRKLEYRKNVLEKAFQKGYIKASSYREGKRKINDLIKGLKKRL